MAAASNGQGGEAETDDSIPLSYQVYTPDAPPTVRPRSMPPSHASLPAPAPKSSVSGRLSVLIFSVCVVGGTAALVMAGASEEPRHRASSTAAKVSGVAAAGGSVRPRATAPRVVIATRPAAPPPVAAAPTATVEPAADPPALPPALPPARATKGAKTRPGARVDLRGVALPANPFASPAVAPVHAPPAPPAVQRSHNAAAAAPPASETSDDAQSAADRKLLEAAKAEQSL